MGSLSFVIFVTLEDNSFSRRLFLSTLIFVFQIFSIISILGFFRGGLENYLIILTSVIINGLILFLSRKFWYNEILKFRFKNFNIAKNRLYYSLLLLISLEFIFFILKAYFYPNYVWDEMVYHLHPVVEWYRSKQILFSVETPSPWVNQEILGSKRMVYWLFTFVGNDSLINLSQTISAFILVLSSYRLLMHLGSSKKIAMLGAISVLNIPLVIIQATTNQEHLSLAAFTVSLISISFEKLHKWYVYLFFLLINMILLIGCKTSAIIHLIVFLPILIFLHKDHFFRLSKKHWLVVILLFPSLICLLVAMLNLTSVGELIRGGMFSFLGNSEGGDWLSKFIAHHSRILILNLKEFPYRILDIGFSRYNADSDSISSFGAMFISFGTVGFTLSIYRILSQKANLKEKIVILYSIFLLGAYFSFYFSPWNYRLFLFFPIFLVLLGIFYTDRIFQKSTLIELILLFLCLFHFISSSISEYASSKRMRAFVSNLESASRTTLSFNQNMESPTWQYISEYVDPKETIAYFGFADAWVYPYFNSDWQRSVILLDASKYKYLKEDRIEIKKDYLLELKEKNISLVHIRESNLGKSSLKIINHELVEVFENIYIIK